MIGQLIFAELPFACLGQPPYLEHGWIKDCAEQNEWTKKLTDRSPWRYEPEEQGEWTKKLAMHGGWSRMLDNRAVWDVQAVNEINTRGCDYTPTNIGER